MIKLYLYDANGYFFKVRTGDVDSVIHDVESDGLEFTLTPPPNMHDDFLWNGSEWVKPTESNKETQ